MKILKHIGLIVAVITLSYFSSSWAGNWYDQFSYQYGGSFLGTPREWSIAVVGFFISYVFLTPFLFELFGSEHRRKWVIGFLIPAVWFWFSVERGHLHIAALLALVGFLLAWGIRKFIRK